MALGVAKFSKIVSFAWNISFLRYEKCINFWETGLNIYENYINDT